MNIITKELYVAAYGQSTLFRLVKYAILIPSFAAIYWWFGGQIFIWTLGVSIAGSIVVHFVFRWKTDGWLKKWGPYTPPEGLLDP